MRAGTDFFYDTEWQKQPAFAVYRLPASEQVCVAGLALEAVSQPHEGAAYFVASRFDCFRGSMPYFLPVLNEYFLTLRALQLPFSPAAVTEDHYHAEVYDKACFLANVQTAVEAMRRNEFQKVVLSRPHWVPGPVVKNAALLFQELCAAYPLSFVCMFNHPRLGCWLTASPELLLQLEGNTLHTVSLAGTRVQAEGRADWGLKERTEQQWVTDYIRDVLERNGVKHVLMQGPETLKLGHIEHLRTRFSGEFDPAAGLDGILQALHPTPAVGGMPKDRAAAFIAGHEGYDRQLYSGFFGPVYANGGARLFVQLRTARIYANGTLYFTGAGITADSDPEAEWVETENKKRILAQFL